MVLVVNTKERKNNLGVTNMKKLEDYIMVIDDVLDMALCEDLITIYDKYCEKKDSSNDWGKDYRSFTEINLIENKQFFDVQIDHIYSITDQLYKFYTDKCDVDFFPPKLSFEDLRMKKYEANDHDQFGWHTDVGDYASARRYLAMFFYLNTVEDGGETMFADCINSDKCLTVKPKRGRIVIFPPLWMFPHAGTKPRSGSKYILSTYCHYN